MDYGEKFFLNGERFTPEIRVDRKIIVEEIIRNSSKSDTLIRRTICQQSCGDYIKEKAQIQVVKKIQHIGNSDYIISNSDFQDKFEHLQKCRSNNDIKMVDYTEEPMEIDDFAHDNLDAYIKPRMRHLNFKRRSNEHVNRECEREETESTYVNFDEPAFSGFSILLIMLFALFTMVGIYFVAIGDRYVYLNKRLLSENIKNDLEESVLFQENAIYILTRTLNNIDSWPQPIKILIFVGGAGIGKTFSANIIKKHFPQQLVHELSERHLVDSSKQQYVLESLNSCCCNLILIDNLEANSIYDVINFAEKIPSYQNSLIIPIFNNYNTTDGVTYQIDVTGFKLIREVIDQSGLYFEIVLFDALEYAVAAEWLLKELEKRGIDKNKQMSIINAVLNDEQYKNTGFKGLHAKLVLAIDNH